MPTRINIPKDADRNGVAVEYTKSSRRLYIHGWYDSMVGIEGEGMSLAQFFQKLGISKKDCNKAFDDIHD